MDIKRSIVILTVIMIIIFWIAAVALFIYLMSLVIRALQKYVNSKEIREEKIVIRKSLGELLKENRLLWAWQQEKRLEYQTKELTRKGRTHRLCADRIGA